MSNKCKICKGSGWITFNGKGKKLPLVIDEDEKMFGTGYIFDQYFGFPCECNDSSPSLSELRMKDD